MHSPDEPVVTKRKSRFIGELKIHSKIFQYNFFPQNVVDPPLEAPKNHKVLTSSPEKPNPNKPKFISFLPSKRWSSHFTKPIFRNQTQIVNFLTPLYYLYIGWAVPSSTSQVEKNRQIVSKGPCFYLILNPFHSMGYDGFLLILFAKSICCNLWSSGRDPACQDVVMRG
jgi:hypothetical protein